MVEAIRRALLALGVVLVLLLIGEVALGISRYVMRAF